MDPVTIATILGYVKRFWWVIPVIALAGYVYFLRHDNQNKANAIVDLQVQLSQKQGEIASLKLSIDRQNEAVAVLEAKGKAQVMQLEEAVATAKAIAPKTQGKLREIYTDKTKDIKLLLLNAAAD